MNKAGRTVELTKRQLDFVQAGADEVLFGGAAGGGKSYAQVIDAMVFAIRWPGSQQLILRRSMPELERTLIRTALLLYPKEIYSYNKTDRTGRFANGSTIEFGYCNAENDVYHYQSAEYDVIRFDELTHFTEYMYIYLISRVRGANGFPKQLKSTTNPGGIGHEWVKRRFIDSGPPDSVQDTETGSRIFLPARLIDNRFLMKNDPNYRNRLKNLAEKDQRALLEGEWDLLDGRYFAEWSRDVHLIEPFEIPADWRRVFTMDYGLDMLAGYWIAVSPDARAYVYREVYEPNHIISSAAQRILAMTREEISVWYAPPDLWNRRQDSGKSAVEIFADNGIELTRASSSRVSGWYAMKEMLRPFADEQGRPAAGIVFFNSCVNAARCIPALVRDMANPNDCMNQPHELTHAPDAIRYFAASWRAAEQSVESAASREFKQQLDSLMHYR